MIPCLYSYVCRACLRVTVTFQVGKPQAHNTELCEHITLSCSYYFGAEPQKPWGYFTAHPKPVVVFSCTLRKASAQLIRHKGPGQEPATAPASTRVCSFVWRCLVSFQSRLKNVSGQHPVLWRSCFCKVSGKAKDRDLMLGGKANTEAVPHTVFLPDLNFPRCYMVQY